MKHRALLFISVGLLLSGCVSTPPFICELDLEPIKAPLLDLTRLDDAPRRNSQRQFYVRQAFEKLGCDVVTQAIPRSSQSNLICKIEGVLDEEIVVSAHHDKLGAGRGYADNWTGIILLLQLIEQYQAEPPLHDLTFIAFAEEESGLWGATHYVNQLDKADATRPRLAINLDTLGVGDTSIGHQSDEAAACLAETVGQREDIPFKVTRIRAMSGDWEPFLKSRVPVVYFHSLNERSIEALHTFRDNRRFVDDSKLQQAYQIIHATLSALDHGIDLTL